MAESRASTAGRDRAEHAAVYAGRYRVVRTLGRGGMGDVFEARDAQSGRRVALKVLRPEGLSGDDRESAERRFSREAHAASRVVHPNVVEVLDVGVDEATGARFIAQEFLDGCDLGEVMERRGRIPAAELVATLAPAMDGVAAAHALGVVHRDLKPSNIFLASRPDGGVTAKVIDFGIAKVHGADLGLAPLAPSDVLVGTPAYMSPEQARGDGEVDARTDVWSFGALLFEAASGSLPYSAPSASALVKKIAHEPPRALSEVAPYLPPEFSAVVDRALSRDPDRRFSDMAAFAAALRAASLETPSQDPVADTRPWSVVNPARAAVAVPARSPSPPPPSPAPPPPAPRHPPTLQPPPFAAPPRRAARPLALAAVVAVVAAALGWWALRGAARSAPEVTPPAPRPAVVVDAGGATHDVVVATPEAGVAAVAEAPAGDGARPRRRHRRHHRSR